MFVLVDIGVTGYGGECALGARPLSAGCATGFRVTMLTEVIKLVERLRSSRGSCRFSLDPPSPKLNVFALTLLRVWRRKVRQQAQPGYEVIRSPVRDADELFSSTANGMNACSSEIFGRISTVHEGSNRCRKRSKQVTKEGILGGCNDQHGFQDNLILYQPHL